MSKAWFSLRVLLKPTKMLRTLELMPENSHLQGAVGLDEPLLT